MEPFIRTHIQNLLDDYHAAVKNGAAPQPSDIRIAFRYAEVINGERHLKYIAVLYPELGSVSETRIQMDSFKGLMDKLYECDIDISDVEIQLDIPIDGILSGSYLTTLPFELYEKFLNSNCLD